VGSIGAKVIVSELDIENEDGDGCCGRAVERVITVDERGGKDVALVDDLKPREVIIGEADDAKVADVINVSVSVVEEKGVCGIQVENKGGGREVDKLITVDRSCTESGAEVTTEVDEIDEVVLIADGVVDVHRGINCVPSADDTPREKE
jgi:hypothetical protein